jgi:hypothetical protein
MSSTPLPEAAQKAARRLGKVNDYVEKIKSEGKEPSPALIQAQKRAQASSNTLALFYLGATFRELGRLSQKES